MLVGKLNDSRIFLEDITNFFLFDYTSYFIRNIQMIMISYTYNHKFKCTLFEYLYDLNLSFMYNVLNLIQNFITLLSWGSIFSFKLQ